MRNRLFSYSIIILLFFIPLIVFIFCACLPIFFNFIRKRKPTGDNNDLELGESNTSGEMSVQTVSDNYHDPPAYEEDFSLPPGYEEAIRLSKINKSSVFVVT